MDGIRPTVQQRRYKPSPISASQNRWETRYSTHAAPFSAGNRESHPRCPAVFPDTKTASPPNILGQQQTLRSIVARNCQRLLPVVGRQEPLPDFFIGCRCSREIWAEVHKSAVLLPSGLKTPWWGTIIDKKTEAGPGVQKTGI